MDRLTLTLSYKQLEKANTEMDLASSALASGQEVVLIFRYSAVLLSYHSSLGLTAFWLRHSETSLMSPSEVTATFKLPGTVPQAELNPEWLTYFVSIITRKI